MRAGRRGGTPRLCTAPNPTRRASKSPWPRSAVRAPRAPKPRLGFWCRAPTSASTP